ncbi:MAG: hypothetical protein LUE64_05645 [Candidatus Gastranaerophilales bacterium]|nr:hypothetical protein [Candidatus Gastranaerophilales bacterium]
MIQPIITANQAIAGKTRVTSPVGFNGTRKTSSSYLESTPAKTDLSQKGEKLDVNCEGCRIHSLNGNKVNYFA